MTLAGCVGESAGPATGSTSPTGTKDAGSDLGSIRGTVTNEELVPLEGALIRVDALSRSETTGPDGVFKLEGLPPGPHRLVVHAIGHQSIASNVEVLASEVTNVQLVLETLEVVEPYTELFLLAGYTECVASLVYFTFYTSLPICTQQKHVLRVDVNQTWRYAVIELTWAGQTSMHFISDTDTNCGFGNQSTNSCFYWKIGRSPMRLDAKPNDPDTKYVQWKMLYPEAFQWVLTGLDAGFLQQEINGAPTCDLGYQLAGGYNADCGGVGIGYPGYRFDLYASVFHHEIPADPAGYSAKPDS